LHIVTGARNFALVLLFSILTLAAGCAQYYAQQADKEVYGIIKTDYQKVLGYDRDFTIDNGPSRNASKTVDEIVGNLPAAPPLPEMLSESGLAGKKEALRELDLASALRVARENSRDYQTQKEALYTAALNLTSQQYVFDPQFALTGSVDRITQGADEGRTRSINTAADFNVTQQFMTGTNVALGLGLTGVKFLNHDLGQTLASALNVQVTQPLWAGSDPVVVTNNLVQAYHNTVYQLRTFSRGEKQLAVAVAISYYNAVQQLDVVDNQWEHYQGLIVSRKRAEWLGDAGRLPKFQVDQARQDELQAHDTYLRAVQGFEGQLDALMILIGLPTNSPVMVTRRNLEQLAAVDVTPVEANSDLAEDYALEQRLDLKNARDTIEDSARQAYVAADALKGTLNVVGGLAATTEPKTHAGTFQFQRGLYDIGVQVSLPINELVQRNTYRQSLINYDASIRSYMTQVDAIKLEIRQEVRQLRRSLQSYEIQKNSVALATKRVSDTKMLLDAGRAEMRDLLDSQDVLVGAQNALSQARVDYIEARLQFAKDLEVLEVDEEGQIHEGNIEAVSRLASRQPAVENGHAD
jgi:outer membrane protein TolC